MQEERLLKSVCSDHSDYDLRVATEYACYQKQRKSARPTATVAYEKPAN
jgi:hypothetical protein